MRLGLVSFKASPGVTTAALALASASGGAARVLELDPAGGDVAARAGMALHPGLAELAAAWRRRSPTEALAAASQELASGVTVVVAPADPAQATAAAEALGAAVATLGDAGQYMLVDAGRWGPGSAATPALSACDAVLVIAEPTLTGVEHLRAGLEALRRETGVEVIAALVGDRPYPPGEVARVIDVPVLGVLAWDPQGAAALYQGPARMVARCPLSRSARVLLDAVGAVVDGRGSGSIPRRIERQPAPAAQ